MAGESAMVQEVIDIWIGGIMRVGMRVQGVWRIEVGDMEGWFFFALWELNDTATC
jgi:hypothetical protein